MLPPVARPAALRALAAALTAALLCPAAPAAGAGPPPAARQAASPPAVTAAGAVLWEPHDDLVLYGKAEDVGRPMASTTKIMTSLLAIEAAGLHDDVRVSPTAAALGQASLGLRPGQIVPMRTLVAGLVLRSANDAAVAVAEHLDGSEAAFVRRMNARAAELGLGRTRFVNASGLTDDPDHRASPLDLARLAAAAMDHAEFAAFAGAESLTLPGAPSMTTRNELLARYRGATGVKTGYTRLAGQCLVASATRGGRTLYAVVLGSQDSYGDAAALLDYGFTAFTRAQPAHADVEVTRYRWADADVAVLAAETLAATVPVDQPWVWRTVLAPSLRRPVARGTTVGSAELVVAGEVVGQVPLVVGEEAAAGPARSPGSTVGAAVQEALRAFVRMHPVDRAPASPTD